MLSARLASELWVFAYKKRLELQGIPIFLLKKGDNKAGAIIIIISNLKGTSKILVQGHSLEGDRRWVELANGPDSEMEKIVAKQKVVDPDLWILEVEEPNGRHFLDDDFLCG